MGTKEKLLKLIFLFAICISFIWLLSMENNVYGAQITGQVVDENDSPIEGIVVNYGGAKSSTSSNGQYSVDGSGKEIIYEFANGKKYEEVLEAVSITYEPKKESKKYNIVIVKPESGYESEQQELESMLSNCKIENGKEVITYNDSTFKYKGSDISNPYQKYCEDMYDNTCINLFIVIGTENMPDLGRISAGGGELWKRNIFYNTTSERKNIKNAQEVFDFNAIKQLVKEYGNIEEKTEEDLLPGAELDENLHVKIKLKKEKNQTIKIKLKEKIEETPPEYRGNCIIGTVMDQNRGVGIKGVGVKLYKLDGFTKVTNREGNIIEARTDENGYYVLQDVPGATTEVVDGNLVVTPKEYIVKFTYGDEEHFKTAKAVTYNGNDYESTEAVIEEIKEEVVTYIETEELVEEPVIEEIVTEEPTKLDIYLVVDCSGSMRGKGILASNHFVKYGDDDLPIGLARKGASSLVNDVYNKYGDGVRIGLVTFNDGVYDTGGLIGVEQKEVLINSIKGMEALGGTATHAGINMASEKLFAEGSREDAKKVMIILTDGEPSDEYSTIASYINAANKRNRNVNYII